MVGAEAEHFLVRRREDGSIVPYDPDGVDTMDKPCYDFKSLSGSMGYLRTLVGYLDQLGWEPYASDHEDGTAQFEINWKYADALTTPIESPSSR
jgi:glutamine synthetase